MCKKNTNNNLDVKSGFTGGGMLLIFMGDLGLVSTLNLYYIGGSTTLFKPSHSHIKALDSPDSKPIFQTSATFLKENSGKF